MAYASITVKDIFPRNRSGCIPTTTIFKFSVVPYNGAVVDIDSIEITAACSGGGNNYLHPMIFTKDSNGVKITGDSTTGYNVELKLFPNSQNNLESGQRVMIHLKAKDTAGVPMVTYRAAYNAMISDQYDALTYLLKDIMELTSDYEQGRLNHNGTEVDFTFKNWSLAQEPKIYKNMIPITTGFIVDIQSGKLKFNNPLRHTDPIDTINADYVFGVFSQEELISFLEQSVSIYNGFRPMTSYGVGSLPIFADAAMTIGAAFLALQSIRLGFFNQQARVKWGESDWKELVGVIEASIGKYEAKFKELSEEKRYNLARPAGIYVPEYTLPGGRSRFFRYMFKEGGV